MQTNDYFLSCDWGTSRFRLRLATPEGEIVDAIADNEGIKAIQARLGPDPTPEARAAAFAEILRERAEALALRREIPLSGMRVMISGMASSSTGWRELPYATAPFPLDGSRAVVAPLPAADLGLAEGKVWLVSGVCTQSDVLRGEECELLGLFPMEGGEYPDPCRVILPGSHCKHALIQDGQLVDFNTYLTGEMCDVIARHSLLRLSVSWPPPATRLEGEALAHFEQGLRVAQSRGLSQGLFRVRARTLLERATPSQNAWFLSGLAIGAELLPLVRHDSDIPIALAGARAVTAPYELALRALGAGDRIIVIPPERVDQAVTLGHARLLRRLP